MDLFDNRLLAALPAEVLQAWAPQLEAVELPLCQVLHEPDASVTQVYFPTDAIVSLLYVMENGDVADIAVVGREGVVGVPAFMGGESMPSRAVVQGAGHGYRMRAETLCTEFDRHPAVTRLLLRYAQALLTQMAQTAVCNRHHAIEQQLCRWLLLRLDAQDGCEVVVTQERIANTMGVRRVGITEAATHLQRQGIIRYRRGRIDVLDRALLEKRCCECYAVVRREYDRLVPPPRRDASS